MVVWSQINQEKGSLRKMENLTIKKQKNRFYWVCSWESMNSAAILTPPPSQSINLSGIRKLHL